MKTIRSIAASSSALLVTAVTAGAHPGHSHADFFSVLQQPLADWQHALITAMAALTAGVFCHLAARQARVAAPVRWTGSVGVALGAALLLA